MPDETNEESVARYYDTAIFEAELVRLTRDSPVERAITLRWLERLAPPNAEVAEIGVARLGFSVRVIGSLELLPERLSDAAARAEAASPSSPASWHFNLALGYGGRDEIVDACKSLVSKLVADGIPEAEIADHIDAAGLSTHLYTADLPDPDLVIRTSGEARLSGVPPS